jgi:hypothetical protein
MKTKLNDRMFWRKSRSREFCSINNSRNNYEKSRNANKTTSFSLQQDFHLKFAKKSDIFASKFNAKYRNVCIHDSLIRNSILNRSNFTYLYMRFDKSFRSRYNFVANSFKRIRNFTKNDFVFAKQNSNRFVEHFFVTKIEYFSLLKKQQILSRFEFLFAWYVFANHLDFRAYFFAKHFVLLANHFIFFANYQVHAANLLEKFVTRRAKFSRQSRKFVELFTIVVILFLSVVILFVIFSTRFAIVKIVM